MTWASWQNAYAPFSRATSSRLLCDWKRRGGRAAKGKFHSEDEIQSDATCVSGLGAFCTSPLNETELMSRPVKLSDLKSDQVNLLRRFTRGPPVEFCSQATLHELISMGLIEEREGRPIASEMGKNLMASEVIG